MKRLRRRSASRGQSMVELALILPVFVLIVMGIFDVGRAVYAFNTVNNAARQGARLAIVDQTLDHIRSTAAGDAVSLGVGPSDVGVDFRDMSASDTPSSCAAWVPSGTDASGMSRCVAVVTVPYEYTAVTPIVGNLIGELTLTGESRFKVDFRCEGAQCPIGGS